MNLIQKCYPLLLILVLQSCGGDSSNKDNESALPIVNIVSVEGESIAVEKSGQFAKFQIVRTGGVNAISINFNLSGNPLSSKGSATAGDFELHYSDGGSVVGTTLSLLENQNSRVIEVRPIADDLNEVPETAVFSISSGTGYDLGISTSESLSIIDATNSDANRKVFLGNFLAQDGVATTAYGSASFILQGDNDKGLLNYTFSNLTSPQVDQHIHLINGPILKDIESPGPLFDFSWDLSLDNGAPFTSEQELLDALFEGRVYVNIHTADNPGGEIRAVLIFDSTIAPPPISNLTEEETDLDIIRFLNQATFGATPKDYAALRFLIDSNGQNRMEVYTAWIEAQFQLPQTELLPFVDKQSSIFLSANGSSEDGDLIRKDAFWTVAAFAKDQLRQRVAFALSQILVISEQNSGVRNAHRGTADYYDTLALHANLSYRDLLEEVTRHAIMGTYLSHLRNEKEDTVAGSFPDENFAREIMQLFTFGLIERNKNGSIKLGPNNLPVQTYDNKVIKEMAQVFTGLSFSVTESNGLMVNNEDFYLNNLANDFQFRWTEPLKFFADKHDTSEKILFTDEDVPLVIPAGLSPDNELNLVIDALVAHSSTAPYVVERLIQRMVTSNPSPDYIERVADAFGETGDMASVVKAILLDEEARNPKLMSEPRFGKFKEPVLQLSAILRLHQAFSSVTIGDENMSGVYPLDYSNASNFETGATLLRLGALTTKLGQEALMSPSVFNFYSPEYSPSGALSSNSLTAPELQLVTELQVYSSFNFYNQLITDGLRRTNRFIKENKSIEEEQLRVRLNAERVNSIWNETSGDSKSKAAGVANFLDFYMNAGRLNYIGDSTTLDALTDALAASNQESGELFELAAFGSAVLPEFMVQK